MLSHPTRVINLNVNHPGLPPWRRLGKGLALCLGWSVWSLGAAETEAVSPAASLWTAHIQPLLSQHCFKCHGELKQKNGLDLTTIPSILKGGDRGPAVIPGQPEQSLVYRFVQPDAEQHMPPKDYQLTEDERAFVRMWIASLSGSVAGAGSATNRDWGAGAEPLVRPNAPRQAPPAGLTASQAIDFYIEQGWKNAPAPSTPDRAEAGSGGRQAGRVRPSRRCDDATFVRRVYLDLVGRIPTPAERGHFLQSRGAKRRAALVEELLGRDEHARYLGEVFDVVLMGRRTSGSGWRDYLEWSFRTNRPWNAMVRDLILARPERDAERGAVRFLFDRKDNHQAIAETVAPAFFGLQIQCAQCHNHPLAPEIKQKHYWGMVAFFNRGKNLDTPAGPAISESAIGGFIKFANLKKESQDAQLVFFSDRVIPETRPGENDKESDGPENYRLSLDAGRKAGLGAVPKFSRRAEFAELATRDNPLLARALVNRIWALLLGRGLVHPVDRMDSAHPPSHPDLLAWLAADFERSGYDVRRLCRTLVLTETYQRGAWTEPGARPAPETFACALEKPLSAEALHRSMLVALGHGPKPDGSEGGAECGPERFAEVFPDLFPVEFGANLKQALFLTNNRGFNDWFAPAPGTTLARLLRLERPRDRVKEAFLAVLGREPDGPETRRALRRLQAPAKSPEAPLRDLLWALASGAEFRLNH